MKKYLKTLKKDRITYYFFLLTIMVLVAGVFFVCLFYKDLPPVIPVFTQFPWGNGRLGITPFIFLPLIVALLLSFINSIFAFHAYKQLPLLSRFLAITSLLITFLMVVFVVRTLQLVI